MLGDTDDRSLQRCSLALSTQPFEAVTLLEPFERRKRLNRELMQCDEEIVRALPRDKRLMPKVQHARLVLQWRCRSPKRAGMAFFAGFEPSAGLHASITYPQVTALPILPILPVPPVLPVLPVLPI